MPQTDDRIKRRQPKSNNLRQLETLKYIGIQGLEGCNVDKVLLTLKEGTFAEETFASGKIREIFGRNFREFRELANFGFFARIIFREFML